MSRPVPPALRPERAAIRHRYRYVSARHRRRIRWTGCLATKKGKAPRRFRLTIVRSRYRAGAGATLIVLRRWRHKRSSIRPAQWQEMARPPSEVSSLRAASPESGGARDVAGLGWPLRQLIRGPAVEGPKPIEATGCGILFRHKPVPLQVPLLLSAPSNL